MINIVDEFYEDYDYILRCPRRSTLIRLSVRGKRLRRCLHRMQCKENLIVGRCKTVKLYDAQSKLKFITVFDDVSKRGSMYL